MHHVVVRVEPRRYEDPIERRLRRQQRWRRFAALMFNVAAIVALVLVCGAD
jgi:hypothetical protein